MIMQYDTAIISKSVLSLKKKTGDLYHFTTLYTVFLGALGHQTPTKTVFYYSQMSTKSIFTTYLDQNTVFHN